MALLGVCKEIHDLALKTRVTTEEYEAAKKKLQAQMVDGQKLSTEVEAAVKRAFEDLKLIAFRIHPTREGINFDSSPLVNPVAGSPPRVSLGAPKETPVTPGNLQDPPSSTEKAPSPVKPKSFCQRVWAAISRAIRSMLDCLTSIFCCRRKADKKEEEPSIERHSIFALMTHLWNTLQKNPEELPQTPGQNEAFVNRAIREGVDKRDLEIQSAFPRVLLISTEVGSLTLREMISQSEARALSPLNPIKMTLNLVQKGNTYQVILFDVRDSRQISYYHCNPHAIPPSISSYNNLDALYKALKIEKADSVKTYILRSN